MKARCIFRMYIWGKQQVLYENICPCTSLKARTPQHVTWPLLLKWKKPYNSPFKKITFPCIMNNTPSVLISKIIANNGVTDHKGIRTSGSKNSPALHHPFLNTLSKVSNGNDFFKNWICYDDTTIGLLCVIMAMLYTSRQTLAGSALALA